MNERLVLSLVGAVICGAIGLAVGRSKQRAGQGLALGFFLGIIGLIILAFLKPLPAADRGAVAATPVPEPEPAEWRPGGLHSVGAQWAPDPTGRPQQRWWNGTAWTDQVLSDATVRTDPL